MNIGKHPLVYILAPLIIVSFVASYMRFVVLTDYLVSYEGECDPMTHSCFTGCADEECTEAYYYALVEKHASDIRAQCGIDITNCPQANICIEGRDRACEITYCDPVSDGDSCDSVGESTGQMDATVS